MHKKILISFMSVCMLLLAACGGQPSVSATPASASLQPVASGPAETASGLYDGPYDGVLPMSLPQISEADKHVFNPERIFDYLATSPSARHDYAITGWEESSGRLYVNISDELYFNNPNDAYFYIKYAFALTDEQLLLLPVFSLCRMEDGLLTMDSALDFTEYEGKTFESVPVASGAPISLPGDFDPGIDTVQKFIDAFVNGDYKDAGSIPLVSFGYENGEITKIFSAEDYEGEDDTGLEDDGDIAAPQNFPKETVSPHASGFGSLPISLLGIQPAPAGSFDPGLAEDYILADKLEFEDCYWIDKAELKSGKLYLYLTDSVSIDADTAYQYLKTKFSLPDDDILSLPMFSDSDCALYEGKMYTPDGWNLKNGDEPEGYDSEYNYNSIYLSDIKLPAPLPVADSANIVLVDSGHYFTADGEHGCIVTTNQFADYLLGSSAEDYLSNLNNLWFKYSNNEINGIAEQYFE